MEVKKYKMARSWITDPEPGSSKGAWANFVAGRQQRAGFRGGQLVQPGQPGVRQGYNGKKIEWTPEKKANLKTWMDNTGSTLEDYKKKTPDARYRIREGDIWGLHEMSEESQLKQRQANYFSKLNPKEKKIVLKWGKNKGKGKWSNKKIIEEYSLSKDPQRLKIRTGEITGKGFSTTPGAIKSLNPEEQRLWNKLNPDLKWEDWEPPHTNYRGNWKGDVARKKKILEQTKGLITEDELAKRLTEEFGQEISKNKVYGRYGPGKKTHLAAKIDELLFKGTYGSIAGKGTAGQIRYFKPPTERDFRKLKPVLGDVRINRLSSKMVKAVIGLDKEYADIYRTGNVPPIKDVVKDLKLKPSSAGNATARLAQIYSGHVFTNPELENIRINKAAGDKMFKTLEKAPFGDPYRAGIYTAALETIDEKLGNKKGTFASLKNEARKVLKEHNIPVYSKNSPFGFNINEIAGVTGSSKSGAEFSQYIDIMEGNLNEKILANYQGQLSKYRQMIQKDPSKLPELSKTINIRAEGLEKAHGIKLPRLLDPSKAGAGLKVAAQQAGYALKMPTGAQTIAQFVKDPTKTLNRFVKTLQIDKLPEKLKIELARIHNCPIKVSSGGRIGFSAGGITGCLEGKLKKDPMKFLNMTGESALASKSKNILGFIKGARGAARVTGLGLAWEAAFAPLIAGFMIPAGESWDRIKHDLAYGSLFEALGVSPDFVPGKGEEEEIQEYVGDAGFKAYKMDELRGELMDLYADRDVAINKFANVPDAKSYEQFQIEKMIKAKEKEFLKYQQDPSFYEGPAGQEHHFSNIEAAWKAKDEGLKALEDQKASNIELYRQKKLLPQENWMNQVSYAGGGIASLAPRRPDAIPPQKGPMPDGGDLSYMFNRARRW